jgi:CO dehydrogenase nickel-insertion accessory protein CooC1
MGIHTMKRIIELTKEVDLLFENIWILGNRFPDKVKEILEKEVATINEHNVKLLGFVSNSEEISSMNLVGDNLLLLSNETNAYKKAKKLFATIV